MTDTITAKIPLRQLFTGLLRNWSAAEILFTVSVCAAVVLLTIRTGGDDLTGIVSALTGILYTLLAGKGKPACYLFGIINSALYGFIAYSSTIYGDMLLNWAYYLPMQFAGLFFWLRNLQPETGEVKRRHLTLRGKLITAALTTAGWITFAVFLKLTGDAAPYLDSATTIISITAMVLGIMRCFEQWIGWTLVNALSIWMWWNIYSSRGDSIATLLMWCVFLICGIIFAVQWYRESTDQ